jgi:hypothetical protein
MLPGKGAYLRQVTAGMKMASVDVGKELDGSSPPSVFIGSWNYPNVLAGPMVTPVIGDTSIMDTPESWIPANTTQEEIIGYRLNMVRGKRPVRVADVGSSFVEKLQEISLSATSLRSEVNFKSAPSGASLSGDHTPYGPSAPMERFEIEGGSWNRDLEKAYYDTDLKASDAIVDLHRKDVPFSVMQKALSTGSMGLGRARRLVPTRWSITAVDTTIGNALRQKVAANPIIDTVRVHEFDSLNNHYSVLLLPTGWQYEWMEAFLRIIGNEELIFADYEGHRGKHEYSKVGGCYYSCRMAVLEALHREGKQAGAIILREAYRGYVPLGVFNVRENVRHALLGPPREFEDVKSALSDIGNRLSLPLTRFIEESTLLCDVMRGGQMRLSSFL